MKIDKNGHVYSHLESLAYQIAKLPIYFVDKIYKSASVGGDITSRTPESYVRQDVTNISRFINSVMTWADTEERHEYWSNIHGAFQYKPLRISREDVLECLIQVLDARGESTAGLHLGYYDVGAILHMLLTGKHPREYVREVKEASILGELEL